MSILCDVSLIVVRNLPFSTNNSGCTGISSSLLFVVVICISSKGFSQYIWDSYYLTKCPELVKARRQNHNGWRTLPQREGPAQLS